MEYNIDTEIQKQKIVWFPKFLKKVFTDQNTRSEIIDFFMETEYTYTIKQYEYNTSGLFESLNREFFECIESGLKSALRKKCHSEYNNVRFHYADYRGFFRDMYTNNVRVNDIWSFLAKKIEFVDIVRKSISKNMNDFSEEILQEILQNFQVDDTIITNKIYKNFQNIKNETIKSQLKSFALDYIKHLTLLINSYVFFYDYPIIIIEQQFHMRLGALIMDLYLLSRIFRSYENIGFIHQQESNKILIVAGEAHIRNYMIFLTSYLKFNQSYAKRSFSKCIDISDLQQPLFEKINIGYKPHKRTFSMSEIFKDIMVPINLYNAIVKTSSVNISAEFKKRMDSQQFKKNQKVIEDKMVNIILLYYENVSNYSTILDIDMNKFNLFSLKDGIYNFDINSLMYIVDHINTLSPDKYFFVESFIDYNNVLHNILDSFFRIIFDDQLIQSQVGSSKLTDVLTTNFPTSVSEDTILNHIKQITDLKETINELNEDNKSALDLATEKGYTKITKYLIENGAVSAGSKLTDILSIQMSGLREDTTLNYIKQIPNLKYIVNKRNKNNKYPLDLAIERQYYKIAKYLIENGAIGISQHHLNLFLDDAIKKRDKFLIMYLLDMGAKLDDKFVNNLWYNKPQTQEDFDLIGDIYDSIKQKRSINKYNQYNYFPSDIPNMKDEKANVLLGPVSIYSVYDEHKLIYLFGDVHEFKTNLTCVDTGKQEQLGGLVD